MKCFINSQEYKFINNALKDKVTRLSYFQLTKQIFGLEFEKWYQSDYWDNRFIPYVIMCEDIAVSSVAVCINDICWKNQRKRYVQISTVMTLPEYRNKGHNRHLMEVVLSEWADKCDAIYLLSNDSVINFYPKFGFEEFKEFQFSQSITQSNGIYRKLDIEDPNDWRLIIKKYKLGNPFSALVVENMSQFVFHCIYSFSKDIYYVDKYDAVVIVRFENDRLTCYDIFTNGNFRINDILNVMANANTKVAYLGFTPKSEEDYIIEKLQEQDTHLFVLNGKENIFKNNRVMFPIVSRA
jgi:predicted GNAT family N-acyltransferase